jgi:hypothetical protein
MANLDITIDRGADWTHVWTVKTRDGSPVDLSDSVFAGQIRDPHAIKDVAAAVFTFDLVTDGTDGKVRVTLPSAQSLLLRFDRAYEYDMFMTLGTVRYRPLWGRCDVNRNYTPPPSPAP